MEAQWYVYFLGNCLSAVSLAIFILRAVKPQFKVFAWLWLMWCVYDLLMFVWCCKEMNYYYLPYGILLLITWKMYK